MKGIEDMVKWNQCIGIMMITNKKNSVLGETQGCGGLR